MRLHTLTLQAFGPFAGREHIDFDALDTGILLVNGPTGSGKSSLLDAVAFALFGDVAGARRTLRHSLRSHHAPPEREPSVELQFSVGTERWKIRRVPQWEAPKRRGSGTTTRHASVQLSQRRGSEWHLVSARMDEAAEMIKDTLGMDLDQFAQVVLLPQGEFAEFLRARPEDRRALLERLFDVDRFDAVERWFAETKNDRVRASETSLGLIETHMTLVTDTLTRLDSPELTHLEWTSESIAELPELLRRLLSQVRARRDTTAEVACSDARLATAAERALDRAERLLADHDTYRRALAELDRWPVETVDAMRHDIDAATRVSGVLKLAERRDRARVESQRHRERRDEAAHRVEELTGQEDLAALDVEELFPPEWSSARSTQLDRLRLGIERVQEEARSLDAALGSRASANLAVKEAATRDAQAVEAVDAAAEKLRLSAEELAAAPDAIAELEAFDTVLAQARRAPALQDRVAVAKRERTRALEHFVTLEREVVRLRAARLSGMAAELAAGLTDGEACPVCGSCDHPHPTPRAADAPAPEELEQAEEQVRHADAARVAAETRLAAATADFTAFSTHLQGALDALAADLALTVEELLADPTALQEPRAQRAAATERHRLARTQHEEAERAMVAAERRRSGTATELAAAKATHESAVAALREAVHRHREQSASLTRLVENLGDVLPESCVVPALPDDIETAESPEARGSVPALESLAVAAEAARRHHDAVTTAARRLARAQTAAQAADQHLATAETELADELVAKGYDDLEQVRAVALDDASLEELRATWQGALEARAAATRTLETPAVLSAAHTPSPQLSALQHRADVLARRSARSREEAASWQRAHDVLDSMRNKVADAVRRHLPLADAAREMQELSNTFSGNGENTHRMRLTSYVLAAHLETVTAMANERLHHMTDGRYQLQYTDERVKGNQRSGLGLLVVDAWTGRSRDTATLSGGEAFMASLALALGLGDAVRADSGGMELHTLFVDEGFGSLDQDTLEHVMEVLDGLREGGRLVGIVSHVSELRARIPTHIDVRKTAEGSTVVADNSTLLPVSAPA